MVERMVGRQDGGNPRKRAGNGPKHQNTNQEVAAMTELGTIAASAVVVENPTRGETATGKPAATFWVQVSHQWAGPIDFTGKNVWCRATGYPANSASKYFSVGAKIMLGGVVREWDVPPEAGGQAELFISVEMIAYQDRKSVV